MRIDHFNRATTMKPMDTLREAFLQQIEAHRRLKPEQRLRLGVELSEMSRRLLEAGIQARHPEYDEREVRLAAIRLLLSPELYRRVYPHAPELEP